MSDDSGYSSRVALPPRTRLAVGGAREATEAMFTEGNRKKRIQGTIFVAILLLGLSVALIAIVAMITWAIIAGGPRLNLALFTNVPSVVTPENAGYRTAILGTLYVIGGVIVLIVPLGVGAAVYLEEFANPANKFNRFVDLNIQNLAGVPSIVFGILGLAFIVRGPLDLGFVAAAGSLTIALLVLPTVILASREAIRAVPSSIRDGSMALGATVWQTVWKQVLPAATPGILTGVILAVSRAIGEAAPLLLVGAVTFVTFNPSFFEGGYTTLPTMIYSYASRPQEALQTLAAAGVVVMLVILVVINSLAIYLRNRFERTW
jgi:phosphate transport system permease protein